jgi:para-nitrobenzyl esterase
VDPEGAGEVAIFTASLPFRTRYCLESASGITWRPVVPELKALHLERSLLIPATAGCSSRIKGIWREPGFAEAMPMVSIYPRNLTFSKTIFQQGVMAMQKWIQEMNAPANTGLARQKWSQQIRSGLTTGISVLALVSLAACGGGGGGDEAQPVVVDSLTKQLDSGLISGKNLSSNVRVFLGIPYAAPPVGNLRWKEPQAVTAWSGVRKAEQFSNACAQPTSTTAYGDDTVGEDCLYLNVWVPPGLEKGAKAPVIVFVHGGAFKTGSASSLRVQGEQLAKKGAVYVSMNYRLGIFGNLALPELTSESANKASGNYQLLDQIAALKWVQRNINEFGGDPNNVTISGQSSGGIAMGILQSSPLAKGLIHRVFAQSGWPGPLSAPATLAVAESSGGKFLASAGVSNVAQLRAKSMADILTVFAKSEISSITPLIAEPVVEGYALPDNPKAIFAAGKQNDVPTVAGYTGGEAHPSTLPSAVTGAATLAAYQTGLQTKFGARWIEVFNLFPAAADADVKSAVAKLNNTYSSARSAVYHATAQVTTGKSPAYVWVLSRLQNGAAAPHGADNPYWHGELLAPLSGGIVYSRTNWDYQLANAMMDSLVAFAKTGNPATSSVPWPAYNPANRKRMNFGETSIAADWDAGLEFFVSNPSL